MNVGGCGCVEDVEVGRSEASLGTDDEYDACVWPGIDGRDRCGVATHGAHDDARAAGELLERGAQLDDVVHLRWRSAPGKLRRVAGDEPPPLEPPRCSRWVDARHRACGDDRPNRRSTGDDQRLDGVVHSLRREGLQHMHLASRLTGCGPAPDDCAGHAGRRHLIELHAVLDVASFHDHDDLAGPRAQRPREVLGVGPSERGASFGHLRSVDEEAGHGSVHGAAPASRYGGAVSETRLTARTADGLALSVVVDGDGEPLLLIPGLGAGRTVFNPIAGDLARHHQVITYDPRGIGESEGGGTLTLAAMALDAVAVLDAAGVEAAAVFGASMGGLIAQHMVVDHPDRVAYLILAATAPGGDSGVDPEPADQAKLLGKGARTPEDAYRIACTVLYSQQFQRAHPEFIEAQIRERALHPVRPRVFSAQFAAMWQPDDSFERLAAVTAPTLVMHGTEDVVTPFENARILARQIPGARLRAFEGCGHLFFHERPAETARVVTEHLRAAASDSAQLSSDG